MGTSVFRIRTAVDFPPVLKSDHTMRSCGASLQRWAGPISLERGRLHLHQRASQARQSTRGAGSARAPQPIERIFLVTVAVRGQSLRKRCNCDHDIVPLRIAASASSDCSLWIASRPGRAISVCKIRLVLLAPTTERRRRYPQIGRRLEPRAPAQSGQRELRPGHDSAFSGRLRCGLPTRLHRTVLADTDPGDF